MNISRRLAQKMLKIMRNSVRDDISSYSGLDAEIGGKFVSPIPEDDDHNKPLPLVSGFVFGVDEIHLQWNDIEGHKDSPWVGEVGGYTFHCDTHPRNWTIVCQETRNHLRDIVNGYIEPQSFYETY